MDPAGERPRPHPALPGGPAGPRTVLRVLGFLLVRSVGQALDELAALRPRSTPTPARLRAARQSRRAGPVAEHEEVRRLLAPWWLPYRHGLDFLGDLLSAATDQAADVAERRRAAQAEADPSSFAARRVAVDDEDALGEDTGLVARFFTNPVALLLTVFVLVALVAVREAFGHVSGGGLSPAPDAAADWWDLHLATWHPLGVGTAVPAPAYVLPLALLATLLLGSAGAAVSAVLVLAVPVGLWGAWRLLQVVGRLGLAAGRAALADPVGRGDVRPGAGGERRLGRRTDRPRSWPARCCPGWCTPRSASPTRTPTGAGEPPGASGCCWPWCRPSPRSPGCWPWPSASWWSRPRRWWSARPSGTGRSGDRPRPRSGSCPLLLAPWWIPAILERAAEGLVLDAGRLPGLTATGLDLLTGRFHDLGAPAWVGLILPVLAALALVPRATRIPVLVCWVIALVTAVFTVVLSAITLDLAAVSVPAATGLPLMVVQGVLVVAATLGRQSLVLTARRDGWPGLVRGTAAVLTAAAALVPLVGLGWFAADGRDVS